jgi:hypothetical protein
MLEKVLRRNPVAGCAGIARKLKILLKHLVGIAADPNVGTRAVERMRLAWCAAAAAAIVAVRAAMGFPGTATAAPTILVIRSHASITSHCCGPGFASG